MNEWLSLYCLSLKSRGTRTPSKTESVTCYYDVRQDVMNLLSVLLSLIDFSDNCCVSSTKRQGDHVFTITSR